ncbi:MAG: hypothetical protein LBJ97_04100 [Mycoplasmataceae bacterium]|nr:hypothetical protein [Mycoplasmataceae bacterium]
MKNNILFLKPYLEKKLWGGHNLSDFNIKLPREDIGEAWIISGIKDKSSIITNEEHGGITLFEFYQDHRAFFDNHESEQYPLLVKLLDCQDDLSVQVHPTLEYASENHDVLSKTEAWYILDALPKSQIVYGHNAKTKNELKSLVEKGQWDKLLNYIDVKKHDLFYVPAGTLHALKKGLVVLEIQQSSDTTFRLYDYGRDKNDTTRKLTVNESLENIITPFVKPALETKDNELLTSPFFSIAKIENKGKCSYDFSYACWIQCVVIEGNGYIENMPIQKGSTFIIGNGDLTFTLSGNLEIITSYIRR